MVRQRKAVYTRDCECWSSEEAKISQTTGSPKQTVIRQCKIQRIKKNTLHNWISNGQLCRRGGTFKTLNTTHHSLQTREVKERVRKSIFYVEWTRSWQVDFDGSRPERISLEGDKKAQSPFISRARGAICLKLTILDTELVKLSLGWRIRFVGRGS